MHYLGDLSPSGVRRQEVGGGGGRRRQGKQAAGGEEQAAGGRTWMSKISQHKKSKKKGQRFERVRA